MKQNKHWGKSFVVVVLTLFIFSFFATSCTTGNAITTPTPKIGQPSASSPTLIETIIPTNTPTPGATTYPKLELIRNASESISNFEIYDDFSGPFDESKWIVTASNTPNSFTYSTQNGNLAVHLGNRLFKNVETLFLEVNPDSFNDDTNGISLYFPPTIVREQSHYGVIINVTDTQNHWIYKFDWSLSYPNIIGELSDANSNAIIHTSNYAFSSQYSLKETLKLELEIIPETGLLMAFIDNQLFDYVQLPIANKLTIEGGGIFVKRGALSDGGDLLLSEFRIGTYQKTGLTLPDDLLLSQERAYQYTDRGIDYYLFDDFENSSIDGKLDRSRWSLDFFTCYEFPDLCSQERGETYQKDGQLILLGNYNTVTLKARDHNLRAIQFDIIGNNETLPNSVTIFRYIVAQQPAVARRDMGEEVFQFFCEVKIEESGSGVIECHYKDGEFIGLGALNLNGKNTINMAYNDALAAFELRVNGFLLGQIQLTDRDQSLFNDLYSSFLMEEYWDINSQQIVLDNFLVGYKSDEPWTEPKVDSPEIIGSLPHSDLFLYDDFENVEFDGSWNIEKWPKSSLSDNNGLWQQDGRLISSPNPPAGVITTTRLDSYKPLIDQNEQVNAIQLEIAPYEKETGNHSVITLVASQLLKNYAMVEGQYICDGCSILQFGCSMHFFEDHEELNCGPMKQTYNLSQPMNNIIQLSNIEPSQTHFLSLELDRVSRTYFVYLDDQMITSYYVPSEFLLGQQTFLITPYYPTGEDAIVARVENVFLGQDANHLDLVEEWKTDQHTPVNNLALGEENIALPSVNEATFMLQTDLPNQFTLSEFNSISYTLEPFEEPPLGWSTNLIFSTVGEDGIRFGCMVMYEAEDNSRIHCDLFANDNPEPVYSEEIPFDPSVPHKIGMNIDPKTNKIRLIWDGELTFEVDTLKPADYLQTHTFRFDIHATMLNPQAGDFSLKFKDLQLGLRY